MTSAQILLTLLTTATFVSSLWISRDWFSAVVDASIDDDPRPSAPRGVVQAWSITAALVALTILALP